MHGANWGAKPTNASLFLGLAHFLRGEWHAAEVACNAALTRLQGDRSAASALRCSAEALLAQIYYERDNLDEAAPLIQSALIGLRSCSVPLDIVIGAYHAAVRLAYWRDGLEAATDTLKSAREFARSRELPHLGELTLAWEAELHLQTCDDVSVAQYSGAEQHRRVEHYAHDDQLWREHYAQASLFIRGCLLSARLGPALEHALRLRQECQAQHRRGHAAACDVYAALALKGRGEVDSALQRLGLALDYAIEEQAVRIFVDAGTGIESLVQCALRQRRETSLAGAKRQFLHQVLRALQTAAQGCPGHLSHREYTVLRELCRGRSNKSIGRLLDLSENTVKFHLKRIYRKLKVGSRDAALAAAERLELLRPTA